MSPKEKNLAEIRGDRMIYELLAAAVLYFGIVMYRNLFYTPGAAYEAAKIIIWIVCGVSAVLTVVTGLYFFKTRAKKNDYLEKMITPTNLFSGSILLLLCSVAIVLGVTTSIHFVSAQTVFPFLMIFLPVLAVIYFAYNTYPLDTTAFLTLSLLGAGTFWVLIGQAPRTDSRKIIVIIAGVIIMLIYAAVAMAAMKMKKSGGELFGKKLFPANAEYYSFVGLAALVIIGIPLCLIIRVHVPLVMTIVVAVYAVCAMIYRTVLMAKNH